MKKKSLIIFLVLLQLGILASISIAWKYGRESSNPNTAATSIGNIYYVSPTGSNANPGTATQPFSTFAYANSKLQPGDTLLVQSGTYSQKMLITVSGTASMRITIKPAPGATVVLDTNYNETINPILEIQGSYIDVSGFTIKNSKNTCERLGGSNNTASDMVVTGCMSHGAIAAGTNITIQRHTVYNTNLENQTRLSSNGWGSGIKVERGANTVLLSNNTVYNNYGEGIASTMGTNVTISDNTVYDNFSINIYIDNSNNVLVERNLSTCTSNTGYTRNGNRPASVYFGMENYSGWGDQFYNVTIRNNFLAYCNTGIMFYSSEVPYGGLDRVYIYNNTLWGSLNTALSLYPSTTNGTSNNTGTVIANNIIQQPANKLTWITDATGMSFHHNFWVGALPQATARGTGDLTGDVKLAQIPVYNDKTTFKLSSSSSAINAGATIASITQDGYSKSRPYNALFDIGVHEYQPTETPTVTATVSPTPTPTTILPSPTVTVYPDALNRVYFTFSKLRYNKYASPLTLRNGDTAYIKNYNPNELILLQVFLYDYEKKGNQGYTKSNVTSTSMYLRTNYLLPTGKRYAYVMKFRHKATGIIATKYFVVYTTPVWNGVSVQ